MRVVGIVIAILTTLVLVGLITYNIVCIVKQVIKNKKDKKEVEK